MTPREFFGVSLMVVGGTVAVLSGGCTLVVVAIGGPMAVEQLVNGRIHFDDFLIEAAIPLTFGVIPFSAGFGLFRWGQSLKRLKDPAK